MPSTPNNTGSKSTAPSSKTKVRKKDINADTFQKYEKEMILNACTEIGTSCMASCRNKMENG